MKIHPAQKDLPKGKPIAIYPKLLILALFRSFFGFVILWLIAFWASMQIVKNNIATVFIIFIGLAFIAYIVWHTKRSKIEYYADAIVFYSPFRHDVLLLNEIKDLVLEFVGGRRRPTILSDDSMRIGYTRYWLEDRDGLTVAITDEYQAYEELLEHIQKCIRKDDGALQQMIMQLNEGGKMTFLQFTITREGIMAENGEFRTWSELKLFHAKFPSRIRLAERHKKPATSKQIIWVELPTRRSVVFEGLLEHFITPY
jgi:hypothetical protein